MAFCSSFLLNGNNNDDDDDADGAQCVQSVGKLANASAKALLGAAPSWSTQRRF